MAVFEETIALKDEVTPAAKRASDALTQLDKGLDKVNTTLVQTESLADKATKPLVKTQPLRGPGGKFLPRGGAPAIPTPVAPELTPPTVVSPKLAPAPAVVPSAPRIVPAPIAPAPVRAEPENLTAKMFAAQQKVNGGPTENLTASFYAKQAKESQAQANPFGNVGGKMQFDAASMKTAQAVSAQLHAELKGLEGEMIKASALGDMPGFNVARQKALGLEEAIAKLPAPMKEVEKDGESMWTKAAHAAQVGKEVIGGAIDGIKASFASLAAGDVKGAIAGLTDSLASIAGALDLIVPGLGQAVGAVIKIAGGFVGITAGLIQSGMEFTVAASQGKKAMIGMFDAMGEGVVTGAELDDMLSELADQTGITKDELSKLTQSFLQMGVTGVDELQRLTLAAQSASAVVGSPAGAEAFTNLTKKIQIAAQTGEQLKMPAKQLGLLYKAGLSVDDIAKKMGMSAEDLGKQLTKTGVDAKKFGDAMTEAIIEKGEGALLNLGSTFENIKKKFDQDIGDMFEDVDVGPFMHEIRELFKIFSQSTESGKTMKELIGGAFQFIFDVASKVVPMVKHFLLYMVLYGLKAYNAIYPLISVFTGLFKSKAVGEAFAAIFDKIGGSGQGAFETIITTIRNIIPTIVKFAMVMARAFVNLMTNTTFLDGMAMAFKAIGVVIGVVVAAIGIAIGIFAALVGAVIAVNVGVMWLWGTIIGFVGQAMEAINGWASSAYDAAVNFISGLVQGIAGGASAVVDAVKGVASGAVSAFTDFLGIKSPSRVMMKLGAFTGEGFVGGLGSAANDVTGAASSLASAAVDGATGAGAPAPAASASSGGGGVVINVFVDGNGKGWDEVTEEMATSLAERLAMVAGAA